jgi:hypothetical protein
MIFSQVPFPVGMLSSSDMIYRRVIRKMALNRYARSIRSLKNQDKFRLVIKWIAPKMGKCSFKDKDISYFQAIHLAINHIFDLSLQAIDKFMPRVNNLPFSAAACLGFQRDHKRFQFLKVQSLSCALDHNSFALDARASVRFNMQDRKWCFLLEKVTHTNIERSCQALQCSHAW